MNWRHPIRSWFWSRKRVRSVVTAYESLAFFRGFFRGKDTARCEELQVLVDEYECAMHAIGREDIIDEARAVLLK